ncbi:hypothetical protein ABPG72_013528 [Tetrahymena utriculariae]
MEYIEQIKESKYFEPIRNTNYFDKKIQKLIEASKVVQKKSLDIVCEYGSKSNFMYFVLEGRLAVFIPKNESDLNQQYQILVEIEKCKKQINKDPSLPQAQQQLQKLQAEWLKIQKQFDSELLNSFKKYQITLKPAQQGWDDEFYLEKKKQINYQTSSLLKKDVCSMKKVGELKSGDCFGEIGAILDKPRTATIISIEKATCLLVSFDKYKEIFSQEQIYELNFRVLNLAQIFQEKSVETEVVAHLATHFQQAQATNTVYREGDKVDGLYLIHNGHVEIFKTQKDYFNNQISIVVKGKGSLLGLEDYFEFDNQSLLLNQEEAKINNKRNGRSFTAVCKDLNMKIYKIDKEILDYFIEGYSHFKSYILTMAHQKFLEYNSKYQKNVELKKKLSNLTLVQQIPKSSKKISVDISDSNNSLNLSQANANRQKSVSIENLEDLPKEEVAPKIKTLQNQIEDQILQGYFINKNKNEKNLNFPEMLRYENSKIKDLRQNYEICITRKKRPQKQQSQSYAKYDAFLRNKFNQQFIQAFEQLKTNQNKKSENKKQSQELTFNDLPENKLSLDFVVQQNQLKSLRFIEQRQKNPKREKSVNNITQNSKDSSCEEDEDQVGCQHKTLEREGFDQAQTVQLTNKKSEKLFKYKSMNLIPSFQDIKVNENYSHKHILQNLVNIFQEKYQSEQKEQISNFPTDRTKSDTDQLPKLQSIQRIEMQHGISIQLLNQDTEQLLSNQDILGQLKNENTETLQNRTNNSELVLKNDSRLFEQSASNQPNQQDKFAQRFSNFQLDKDKSGKKVILRINRNRNQSEQFTSPQPKSQNCSLHQIFVSENQHQNNDQISLQSYQPSERRLYLNNQNNQSHQNLSVSNHQRTNQQSLIDLKVNNNNSCLVKQNLEEKTSNNSQQLQDTKNYNKKILNSIKPDQTPLSINSTHFDSQKHTNSPFLPKINSQSLTRHLDQDKQKIISSFNFLYSNHNKADNDSNIKIKSNEAFSIKSPLSISKISQQKFEMITPNKNKVIKQFSSPKSLKMRLSMPFAQNVCEESEFKRPHSNQLNDSMHNLRQEENQNFGQDNSEKKNTVANQNYINKFFFSQQASKRFSIQPEKFNNNSTAPIKNNRYSSLINIDNESQINQSQSIVSSNLYNSHIFSNQEDLQNSLSPSKKIKLKKIVKNNNFNNLNFQPNNQSYSKPTQNLQRIQMREQIMDDIQTKLGFFPQKKKNEAFYKDSALRKFNSHELKSDHIVSPTSPQRQAHKQQVQNLESVKKLEFTDYANNKSVIQEEEHQTIYSTPQNQVKSNHQKQKLLKGSKSPQSLHTYSKYGNSLAQIYKLQQMVIGTSKKQLNPQQLMLYQKQSKTSNNYISNLFNSKLNQQQIQ